MAATEPPSAAGAACNAGLTAVYRDMTDQERHTFWACFGGWALDGMDFMIYPLVLSSVMALWQVSKGSAGLAVTLTLIASAFGGWVAGYLSDRIGRVRTLPITILWFSFFSLLWAFARTFGQLIPPAAFLSFRLLGEWAAAPA